MPAKRQAGRSPAKQQRDGPRKGNLDGIAINNSLEPSNSFIHLKIKQMQDELTMTEKTEKLESYELITRETVPNSPFTIVTTDQGSFIAMGRYRLTDFLEYEDAKQRIEQKDWDIICSVISVLLENIENVKINEQ